MKFPWYLVISHGGFSNLSSVSHSNIGFVCPEISNATGLINFIIRQMIYSNLHFFLFGHITYHWYQVQVVNNINHLEQQKLLPHLHIVEEEMLKCL